MNVKQKENDIGKRRKGGYRMSEKKGGTKR